MFPISKKVMTSLSTLGLLCAICIQPVSGMQNVQDVETIAMEEGFLGPDIKDLNSLLSLRIDDSDRLRLDRDVWHEGLPNAEERRETAIKKFMEDHDMERERAERFMAGGEGETAFEALTQGIAHAAGNTGRGRNGSENDFTANYRGKNMFILAKARGEEREISFEELKGAERTLQVKDNGSDECSILLLGSEYLVRVIQKPEKMSVTIILGDNVFSLEQY